MLLRRTLISAYFLFFQPCVLFAQSDCGQNTVTAYQPHTKAQLSASAEPVTIDYAVFYTPEARATQGGQDAMLNRITTAFQAANQIFQASAAQIVHRVVHIQELPLNNSSQTLPELGTELANGFDFFSVLDSVAADTSLIIVNFQIPGGYANIPGSPGQAGRGGGINLGLPNLSGTVLAHEIGHTLGAGHDYVDTLSANFYIPPDYNYGNHFIGTSSAACYRTIMSARTTCRIPGYTHLPANPCNLFSNPLVLFDGTPTGDPLKADAVRMFKEFAPFVGNTRGPFQLPEPVTPTPTPVGGSDGDGNNESPVQQDTLTLKIARKGKNLIASGRCLSASGTALMGDSVAVHIVKSQMKLGKVIKKTVCNTSGRYQVRFSQNGLIQARNLRTEAKSRIISTSRYF